MCGIYVCVLGVWQEKETRVLNRAFISQSTLIIILDLNSFFQAERDHSPKEKLDEEGPVSNLTQHGAHWTSLKREVVWTQVLKTLGIGIDNGVAM